MKDKRMTAAEAVSHMRDGHTIMIGGFLKGGFPNDVVGAVVDLCDAKNLTLISNDTGIDGLNSHRLMLSGRVTRVYSTYIGRNTETVRRMNTGEAEVILVPQGTLAERIRAGGAGLGGVLTPTGLGTMVAEGKDIIQVNGKDYLLETALRANIAIVYASKADRYGNLFMRGTTKNFNAIMPAAADFVIAEAQEYIEDGFIDPELVTVPGALVDAIVVKGGL